jgi:plasmid stability protein
MKNVTIALDDETHLAARIRAAELGTSLSGLVKDYLQGLVVEPPVSGVREMSMSFAAEPLAKPLAGGGPPYLVNSKRVYTKDGKPRQLGSHKAVSGMVDYIDEWPSEMLAFFEKLQNDSLDDGFDALP